jgi:elongation factor Ts
MAEITASLVKELREKTGAGMMDCKKALTETSGDLEGAVDWLRKKGLAAAAKKAGRVAAEGLVAVATADTVGAVVEVNSETDFVARNDRFQELVRALAVQVAGLSPRWVDVEEIPEAELAAKRAELAQDPSIATKPAEIQEKILDGQLKKWFKEVVLLEQPYRDEERSVRELVNEAIATIGENIQVRRFTRYALGEDR